MPAPLEQTFRPYQPGDATDCLALFDSNVPTYFRPPERPEFERFLAGLPGPYFVLVDADGPMVACGGYAVADGTADLCWGMVHRDRQGRGLGRQLTELRLSAIRKDRTVSRVRLQTSHLTVPFYERLGFETVRTVAEGYGRGLHRHDMVLQLR